MAEVVFDGVGTPVIDPNITGAEVNLTPGAVIFTNATSSLEVEFDGVGVPVATANGAGNLTSFDNDGKDVSLGAPNAVFNNDNSPTEEFFGTAGIPVGGCNSALHPVTFDNQGINVCEWPQIGPPGGNATERKFFSPPLNFNP